jgi:hypothetical protein
MGCIIEKNPSKADARRDDPTMTKNIRFGQAWGWRGLLQQNLSDYIATDASELCQISDSLWVSDKNLAWNIIERIREFGCTQVVCAWGTHSNRRLQQRIIDRGDMLVRRLIENNLWPLCLKINGDGTPSHTLYLNSKLKPIPYKRAF